MQCSCPSRSETFTGRYLQNVQAPFAPKSTAQCTGSYSGVSEAGDVCCMHVDEGRVNDQTFAVPLAASGYTVGFFGKTLSELPVYSSALPLACTSHSRAY